MKKILAFALFISIYNFIFAQINVLETIEIAKADAARANSFKNKPAKIIGKEYDLKFHRFNWTVDPAIQAISGSVTSYFVAKEDNLSKIIFSLKSNMIVDSVKYHGVKTTKTHSQDLLNITISPAISIGTLDSVTVYYHGSPDYSGFGSFITSTHGSSNAPILWTLSEPYGAFEWCPCKNDLSDKIDSIDVFITYPNGNHAASNGILVSETTNGAFTTSYWKHRYPIAAYLIAIAVTNYKIYTENFSLSQGNLPILNYVFPEDYDEIKNQTPFLQPVMRFYDSIIAPYPYMDEKYGHAQFGWGGGMEHQTMSFMGGFGYELMAHELLHQWYGDAVTCGSWSDIWLNEGFATYYTALNYDHFFHDTYWKLWKKSAKNYITGSPNGSVYVYDTSSVSRVFDSRLTYYKAAFVLHMLRWVVGDDNFFTANRNYFNDPKHHFGYALTPDYINHVEAVCGKDLTNFFNNWIYKEGHPSYQIYINRISDDSVSVRINQTQSHSSVSFFEMPIPISFYKNGIDTTFVFDNTFSGQEFFIHYPTNPDSIIFDKENWILSNNNSINLSLNENKIENISLYPNPSSDKIYIDGLNGKDFYFKIFDNNGKIVISEKGENNKGIPIQKLEQGSYNIVLIQNEKEIAHFTFIKQ